ncbi:MAG TPA: hypothetical protein VG826_30470 [Pirellulales bacterium]|nr:hypothetical protein [Pirellulales bacterium]
MLVRAFQLIVTVRLCVGRQISGEFPAVLDTGHSHNFSISEALLHSWTGFSLLSVRTTRVNGVPVPVAMADVELEGHRLRLPDGIAVFPQGHPAITRLPLVGLRAIVRNRLKVSIEGDEATIG